MIVVSSHSLILLITKIPCSTDLIALIIRARGIQAIVIRMRIQESRVAFCPKDIKRSTLLIISVIGFITSSTLVLLMARLKRDGLKIEIEAILYWKVLI